MAPDPRQVQRVGRPPNPDFMPERTANIASVDLGPGTSSFLKSLAQRHLRLSVDRKYLHLAPHAFPALIAAPTRLPNARQNVYRFLPGASRLGIERRSGGPVNITPCTA